MIVPRPTAPWFSRGHCWLEFPAMRITRGYHRMGIPVIIQSESSSSAHDIHDIHELRHETIPHHDIITHAF